MRLDSNSKKDGECAPKLDVSPPNNILDDCATQALQVGVVALMRDGRLCPLGLIPLCYWGTCGVGAAQLRGGFDLVARQLYAHNVFVQFTSTNGSGSMRSYGLNEQIKTNASTPPTLADT